MKSKYTKLSYICQSTQSCHIYFSTWSLRRRTLDMQWEISLQESCLLIAWLWYWEISDKQANIENPEKWNPTQPNQLRFASLWQRPCRMVYSNKNQRSLTSHKAFLQYSCLTLKSATVSWVLCNKTKRRKERYVLKHTHSRQNESVIADHTKKIKRIK